MIQPWFPSDDYKTVQTGMLSIAGVDGFRAAFSLAEVVNRTTTGKSSLCKGENLFPVYSPRCFCRQMHQRTE